jgi:hypothetical protein
MQFNVQPSGIVGANSPLIYQFYDTNFASTNFVYKVQVFVWTGASTSVPTTPQATIERLPDIFASGRAFVDTHKIVQQYLTTDFFTANTDMVTIGGGAVWTLVKVQGFYGTSSSTSLITSNTILATNGYSYMESGINSSLATTGLFTSKTKFVIPQGASRYYIWFDASIVTQVEIDTTAVNSATVTGSANRIQGVDLVDLYNDSGVSGDTSLLVTTTTGQFFVTIERPCQNRYGQIPVHFLNRWGVYETHIFNALHRTQIEVTREQYQRALFAQTDLTEKWAYGYQINTPYLVNAKEQYTLNTNYIAENENDTIQQLNLSENVLIFDGNLKSATITDTSLPFKTRTNDKLIDYTIQLSVNSPVINKVVR